MYFYGILCFVVLLCLTAGAPSRKFECCYAENSDFYSYTGTKTSYHYVHNGTAERIALPHCKPLQIWLLCRHGTRYPNAYTIARMLNLTHFRDLIIDNHENGKRGFLCDKDLYALKNWQPTPGLDEKKRKHLIAQGERDLSSLGSRLRIKFPELFVANKSANYKFRSTDSQRTIASMEFFIKGAFGDKFAVNPEIIPTANDTLLKIYATCEPWLDEVKNMNEEVKAFIDGPEMAKVITDVSRRLGFARNISKEETFLLYDVCRFEKAWYLDRDSPWCAALTDDAMRVFEYEEDLFHYYRVGYGQKINSKLGCQPLRDMFDHFTKLEQAKDYDEPKGVFHFTHSQMMMLFFTAMNIGKDATPMTASNFRNMEYRKWRTSLLVPFTTNVAAVFYSCNSNESPFKVAFYLAENPLTLEGCENGVCDWTLLKKKLAAIVAADCNPEFCRRES